MSGDCVIALNVPMLEQVTFSTCIKKCRESAGA
jgi:hypothetical protein